LVLFNNMGVIGLDLRRCCLSGMPRTPGWPRKTSGQNTNGTKVADTVDAFLAGITDTVAEPALAAQTV
jgi:hypothetical protein